MELRDYQQKFLNDIRSEFGSGKRSICAVAPTGSGKTIIIAAITEYALKKGNRIFIVAHRIELIDQISEALNKFNINHGIISPDYPINNDYLVQVCSVDTLIRRLEKYTPPTLIITDECHHVLKNKWGKVLEFYSGALNVGFTATPIRTNGQGLGINSGGFFDSLVEAPTTAWLIEQGYLSPARYFVPPQVVDLAGVRSQAGDYNIADLEERLNKSLITGDAIQHYKNICSDTPAIAFCASIRHAQAVAEEFSASGISSDVIHGNLDKVTRKNLITGLGDGVLKVLTSVNVINEGTDVPIVTSAILLRPTQSLSLYLQQIGRVLRTHQDKSTAFILDHVGNVLKHGFADTPRTWSLEGTKKSRKNQEPTIAMKQCPSCYCCHKPASECPSCGHKYKVTKKEIKKEQGELKELSKDDYKLFQKKIKEKVKNAHSLDALLLVANEAGYHKRWAEHVWAGKQLARDKYSNAR